MGFRVEAVTLGLQEEHVLIERFTTVLEWTRTRVESGIGLDEDFISSQLSFLRDFVISCHFAKEELYVFPKLRALGDDIKSLELELEEDHNAIRALTDKLKAAWETGDVSLIDAVLGDLVKRLLSHQEKENSVAFAYVEMYTSDNEKSQLLNELRLFDAKPECNKASVERQLNYMFSVMEG
ncbi:hemerythrin domain-containing protein [Acidilobus saccharovorans]|uniref:hemerythrin domain-containing protein n=1 Tax=Acidilobus saccharovorans TaxID=242703 RepID=UPI000A0557B2|nr:hemerythrin domain-containing protein [Acidilobus saccharovorans]